MSDKNQSIPEFDNNGNLPIGIHRSSIDEVTRMFGGSKSLKRSKLTASLREFYQFIRYYSIGIYLDGSYVTSRLSPNDIDIIVVLPKEFTTNVNAQERLLFFQSEYQTRKLHIFAFVEVLQEKYITKYLELFTKDRDGNPKGIIFLSGDKK